MIHSNHQWTIIIHHRLESLSPRSWTVGWFVGFPPLGHPSRSDQQEVLRALGGSVGPPWTTYQFENRAGWTIRGRWIQWLLAMGAMNRMMFGLIDFDLVNITVSLCEPSGCGSCFVQWFFFGLGIEASTVLCLITILSPTKRVGYHHSLPSKGLRILTFLEVMIFIVSILKMRVLPRLLRTNHQLFAPRLA